MRRADCLRDGGETPPGDCDRKGTYCCTAFLGCGGSAHLKRVYIERPEVFETSCNHNIIMINENICQLRLDFEEFELAPPFDVGGTPTCIFDNFQVKDFQLCGVNDGQHVYVDVTPGTQLNVELTFTLTDRMVNPGLVNPRWRILVTQIECPPAVATLRDGRNLIDESVPYEQYIPEITREPKVYHTAPPAYVLDQAILAPRGCLQYFPNPSGIIESFNFQNGRGTYPGNMNYAICFRRRPNDKRISFTSHFFQLGFTILSADNEGYDNICFTQIESPGRSEDYLFIPQAVRQSFPNVRASYFCAQSLANTSVIATQSGPFVIHFNSDSLYDSQRPEIGFRMSYQIS
uniref:CUB domain-containing protein n=2 Tax=Lutzomyia longipalpis TaxID=7200 RepID=A0A1B0GI96_LUTLO